MYKQNCDKPLKYTEKTQRKNIVFEDEVLIFFFITLAFQKIRLLLYFLTTFKKNLVIKK